MNARLFFCISIVILSLYVVSSNFVDSKFLLNKKINLGLDLKGGSYLLLQVRFDDFFQEISNNLSDDIRSLLQKNKINYRELSSSPAGVRFTVNDDDDIKKAKKVLKSLGDRYNLEENLIFWVKFQKSYLQELRQDVLSRAIKSIRLRVDEAGVKESSLQFSGNDLILLQMPGMDSPEQIKNLLGKTAKLSFHLLADKNISSNRSVMMHDENGVEYKLHRRAEITGNLLKKAIASVGVNGRPVVHFAFNNSGAVKFARLTRENTGKILAIVLDNTVVTAPMIREPILGGHGEISGNFDINTARDIAIMLRSGALPAPLDIVEQSTVGPSLGMESIVAGEKAVFAAFLCVVCFMLIYYRRFGVYAVSALTINLIILTAILTILEATLTLPGIAGIVLTIGMAVDANILIFERIREELRANSNAVVAVDKGFHRAFAAIFDSNMTTIIAAIIMFVIGWGSIRGFAVTLSFGILSSMFSALFFTKIIMLNWAYNSRVER